MTFRTRIANTLATVLRFDDEQTTARGFVLAGEDYIITEGTGEGPGVFVYLTADVEQFLSLHPERADYSADFCAEVSPVETEQLAWALAAEGKVLLRAGTCDPVLVDGTRVEAGETAEDYDVGAIVGFDGSDVTVAWDSEQTTTQAVSVLRPEGERPVRDYEFALDVNDPLAGLVNEYEMDDTAEDVRARGAEVVAHELIQTAAGAGAGPTGMEMLRATIAALKALALTADWRAPITEAEAALSAAAHRYFETHETGDEYAAIMMGGDNFSAPPLGWVLDLGDGRMAAAIGDTGAVLVSRIAPHG